ncbi:MAG: AAA family ATPase [Gemmataceae bacterium]|nr:AAA family ATPase [Gemmataceae bacterium]
MLVPQIAAFRPLAMDHIDTAQAGTATDWLWHGLIARGNITLFTSQWKAGKTTLITGLLQAFAAGGTFLNRKVASTRALVVSEESRQTWADRLQRMPVGKHCQLLARPFPRRPSPEEWDRLTDHALEQHAAGELDLLVVDPLAKFLPGSTESDLNALLRMLDPLQQLTEAGVGVLILHHPRKTKSDEGSSARGSGGLLAAVDIIIELSRYGGLRSDECRRKLFALSRYPETPKRMIYEWNPATALFTALDDPNSIRFEENWILLLAILKKRKRASTHQELLMDWPEGIERPSPSILYDWLNRAFEENRLRREGTGRKADPYCYRLQNEDDEYRDRGELPPLRDLPWLGE